MKKIYEAPQMTAMEAQVEEMLSTGLSNGHEIEYGADDVM